MTGKQLGKIQKCEFGKGGYQDAMVGISFTLGGEGWGVGDFWGYWATEISRSTQWTHDVRIVHLGQTVWRIDSLLNDAKVQTISELKNTPIEAIFEGNTLKSWRVLKEVI